MLLRKTFRFEASHILPNHPGKCSRLHGHSWVLHASVSGPVNLDTGFVMDYADISKIIKPIIDGLDHTHLGAFPDWMLNNIPANHCGEGITVGFYPSSENLLVFLAKRLGEVAFPWCTLALEETCTSYAEISREEFIAKGY